MQSKSKSQPGPRRRTRRSTTDRGYGYSYQQDVKRYLAAWRPGDPCARCGRPMTQRWMVRADGKRVSAIELGHTDDRRNYTGLEHARCNRSAGATFGNQRRGRIRAAMVTMQGTTPRYGPPVAGPPALRTSRTW